MTRGEQGYPHGPGAPDRSHALIDVVIVTARGSWALLDDCLRSLRAHPPADGALAVQVIDNASRDGVVAATRAAYPEVTVRELPGNDGFAHGCNVGITRSQAPFVLLLNPDTIVKPGALEILLQTLVRHPRAAIVGPRLIDLDGHPDHNAKRGFPTPIAAVAHFAGIDAGGGYRRDDISELGADAVDAVSGSCMLVRRAAIAEVGLLDEGYWMYGEDLDWCARFARAGWEVRYEGAATVIHVKHGLTGRHRSLRTNWAFHRSMARFYRRFDAGANGPIDAAVFTGVLARFVVVAAQSAVIRAFARVTAGRR